MEKYELNTLRWRLLSRAAVWSQVRGKPTIKLAVRGDDHRRWWREVLAKLTALPTASLNPPNLFKMLLQLKRPGSESVLANPRTDV